MSETWRSVAGFEGIYDVSDQGNVRSWRNQKHGLRDSPRLMKTSLMGIGYKRVTFSSDADYDYHYRLVHRLVLEAFIGPQPEGREGCHLNGDRADARLENLIWGTHSENMQHRNAHGTDTRGEKHHNATLTDNNVREIRALREQRWKLHEIAEKLGVTKGVVQRVAAGNGWTHVA